jgi:hypothetical protein
LAEINPLVLLAAVKLSYLFPAHNSPSLAHCASAMSQRARFNGNRPNWSAKVLRSRHIGLHAASDGNHAAQSNISNKGSAMNEYEADENFDYEIDDNAGGSPPCASDEYSDDDSVELKIDSQSQYYGRWAAEKWLVRLYFCRCRRLLLSRFRPVKPTENTSDELPF